MKPTPTLVLASASPRRRELVERLGLKFELMPANIDETRHEGETPCELVSRLACGKAHACRETLGTVTQTVILAADTIVWMDDGRVMGKPTDRRQARMTLERLSGRTHHVSTGVCILDLTGNASEGPGAERVFVETTDVSFRRITPATRRVPMASKAWVVSLSSPSAGITTTSWVFPSFESYRSSMGYGREGKTSP